MRFHPTQALVRSLLAGAGLMLLAVVLGRPDVLVLAAPFVVHLAWAVIARPASAVRVEVGPRSVVVPEGDSVDLAARVPEAPAGAVLAVQWPQVASSLFDPESGTVLGPASSPVVTTFEPRRWGLYVAGPALVSCTDASGAWRAWREVDPVTVTVRPASSTLEGGSGVAQPIGLVGAHRSRHRGSGSDLADVRSFQPGDRLRRINWRVTSRMGALHVNSMLMERDTDVLVVADTFQDVAPADDDAATSLDATVRAITAISRHYAGFGDRVAVHDLGHRIGDIRPGSGPRHVRLILGVLSRARRSVPKWLGMQPTGNVASGTLVFFCSPLLQPEVVDELVRLRRMGAEVIAVDTLPEGVGRFEAIGDFRKETFLGEAWLLRRLERDEVLARLRHRGVPVVPWRGTGSLVSVLLAMEATRSAPRRGSA